jgi:hypothetical protein
MIDDGLLGTLMETGVSPEAVRELPVDGSTETVVAFEVSPDSWFESWTAMRALVGQTGHWPFAVTTPGSADSLTSINRFDMQGPDGLDVSPSAIIERVPSLDIERVLDAERERLRAEWKPDDEALEELVFHTKGLEDLDAAYVRSVLGPDADRFDIDRWLLERLGEPVSPQPNPSPLYMGWWVPEDPVLLLLLPTVEPWAAGAFVGGFSWGWPHTDLRTALLRRWHQQYGVEPAANWGTMLQLTVKRPPATFKEALPIA